MSTTMKKGSINQIRAALKANKENEQEVKKTNTYHKKKYSKYYDSKRWKDLRNMYINSHPLCENHMKYGRLVEGKEVHHKRNWAMETTEKEKWDTLLDYNNLMTLCPVCHKEMHRIAHAKGLQYVDDCVPIEMQVT